MKTKLLGLCLVLSIGCGGSKKEQRSNVDRSIETNGEQPSEIDVQPIEVDDMQPIPHGSDEHVPDEPSIRTPLSKAQMEFNSKSDLAFERKIPPKAMSAIKKFDPTFEPWSSNDFIEYCGQPYLGEPSEKSASVTSVPWGVVGDFNNDGKRDLAVMGRNETSDRVLVAMRKGRGFKIIEIDRQDLSVSPEKFGLGYYMEFMENSVISIPNEDYSFSLQGDAFILSYCGRNDILHYLENGEFTAFALTEGPD